ncbi:MAG TPA: ROK family protein [Solirubrobacteraceae bacterium]|nr:ROK family protein [Solirubrobacteraceae bacterium]
MTALVIGVDVGGTKISVAELGADAVLTPTDLTSASRLIEQIVEQVRVAAGDRSPDAVGVGIPSVIEFATGRVRSSVNIPLHDVALREELSKRLGTLVFVDNDATLAALAEAHDDGGLLAARHLVMLTLGTGVGGGIVVDGRIYRGATGAAGELGQTMIAVDPDDQVDPRTDPFPRHGSLESLAAGHVLDQLARDSAAAHPDSALGRLGSAASGPDAVAAAQAGDPDAIEVVAHLGRRLGIGIANVINTFDPDVVAIGGGVCAAGELLLGPARESAKAFVLPGVGTSTEIRIARAGPHAGVRGAALLARGELTNHVREGHPA